MFRSLTTAHQRAVGNLSKFLRGSFWSSYLEIISIGGNLLNSYVVEVSPGEFMLTGDDLFLGVAQGLPVVIRAEDDESGIGTCAILYFGDTEISPERAISLVYGLDGVPRVGAEEGPEMLIVRLILDIEARICAIREETYAGPNRMLRLKVAQFEQHYFSRFQEVMRELQEDKKFFPKLPVLRFAMRLFILSA